jgi:MoxR-like ATPase
VSNEIATLSLVLQTPGALPPLIWGDFGIGKTQRVLGLAAALGWDVEMLRPAERGEGAFGVVPVPSEDRSVLLYPMPEWAARLADSEAPGLVFLDEVSSTPPALQPAIMGLALDGMVAGKRLPAHVRRAAAANPVDQAAGGWDLAPALANRFVHIGWPAPAADAWVGWLSGNGSPDEPISLDLAAFSREYANARALGAAFIRSHPGALHEEVARVLGRTPPAFATPRTWECALRLLAATRACQRHDLYPALAQGCLGPSVALEGSGGGQGAWLVWLSEADLPDPEALLADAGALEHDPRRPDRTFAALLAVAEAALATQSVAGAKLSPAQRGRRWEAAFKVMQRGLDLKAGKDTVLLPSRVLTNRSRRPAVNLRECPAARAVCDVLVGFLDLVEG